MAAIDQAPVTPTTPEVERVQRSERAPETSPLDSLLARAYTLNWEMIFYIGLLVVAVLTRFVGLGDRVMSHDESLHVKYSDDLWKLGNFQHTPLMHGPVLFHMTALSYFLFGDTDFTARLYPAILGVFLVLMPKLLFERWLGKFGAMVASVMLLISPMVLYHNRYIREDTPSIFFTLLMVYAIFAYVDGRRPKRLVYLILLSAAMLLSLASKEVAFMYIAIFGFVLTLFWLLQVAQGVRSGATSRLVGWVLGGVVGVILWAGASYAFGTTFAAIIQRLGVQISSGLIILLVAGVLAILGIFLFSPLRAAMGEIGDKANSIFKLVIAGFIMGVIGAMGAVTILSIIPANGDNAALTAAGNPALAHMQFIWFMLLAVPLILLVIATALARFSRSAWAAFGLVVVLGAILILALSDAPILTRLLIWAALVAAAWLLAGSLWASGPVRFPWLDAAIVILVGVITTTGLTYLEERTRNIPKPDINGIHDEYILLAWIIGIGAVAGLLFLRFRTNFFEEMKRYPVFDVLVIMGTLVLPWLSAFPIFQAGYQLDTSYPSGDVILAGIRGTIPFVVVSIVAGLCWNPTVWLACAATFYSIFAFFYTTIFTNINGIFTGLIGSLGYWLAQQGVRRGSQPQYYYLLVELPMYEYLPIIGGAIAGLVGLLSLWRFRAERYAAAELAGAMPTDAGYFPTEEPGSTDQMAAEEISPEGVAGEPGIYVAEPIPDDATQISAMNQTAVNETLPPLPDSPGDPEPLAEGEPIAADEAPPVELPKRHYHPIAEVEVLDRLPFLPFVGVWAVLIIMAFTMAGEKMPWLTTHLTIPLIFATGWYVGTLLEKVEWSGFWKQGWVLIVLTPIFLIALANVIGPFLLGNSLFVSLQRDDLLRTFTWMGAILLAGLIAYAMIRIWRRLGTTQAARIVLIGVFALLGLITLRTAWMAAFINYDSAREFLVYAHGAPADKTIMQYIEDISKRTSDGMNIKVAYDSEISWPGTWYFRNYPNARFLGDNPGTATDLDTYLAIVVGNSGNSKVEALLGDKFTKTKYIRLWWPMQDYFDLTADRVNNVLSSDTKEGQLSGAALRQGIWDIWWNRDYAAYGKATNKTFDEANWPVSDPMYFYVRKDIAAQVWDFGTGAVKVAGLPEDPFSKLNCDQCVASATFASQGSGDGQLNHPRDLEVGPDGKLYVADSQNARIAIFDADGTFIKSFGVAGSVDQQAPGGSFREPWGVAIGKDGVIYVADTWNHRVQVFTPQGEFVRMWGEFEQVSPGVAGKDKAFWGPRDIAVDAQNNLYVADTGNKRIRVYDTQGNFQYDIGPGDPKVQLNEPVGLAIDSETGDLYIADTWNKRVQVYNVKTRQFTRSWNVPAWGPTTESGNRPYLALDKTGRFIFVTDPDAGRVLVFDTKGTPVLSFGKQSNVLGGIAVSNSGQIFIADANAGVILRFSEDQMPKLVPVVPKPQTQPQSQPNGETF